MVVSVRIAILQRFGAAVRGARALTMIIYGLHGFNHGGAKALAADADVITNAGARRLTYYLEKRAGALARRSKQACRHGDPRHPGVYPGAGVRGPSLPADRICSIRRRRVGTVAAVVPRRSGLPPDAGSGLGVGYFFGRGGPCKNRY